MTLECKNANWGDWEEIDLGDCDDGVDAMACAAEQFVELCDDEGDDRDERRNVLVRVLGDAEYTQFTVRATYRATYYACRS